ncbi:MAG: HprK-related kinase B [Deltaproteobacteria bacterium]|nr:HprK-related kinase B [Deltaproteobacteria bacterium]
MNINKISADILAGYPALESIKFNFNGLVVTLFSNSTLLLDRLARYFDGFMLDADNELMAESDFKVMAIEKAPPIFKEKFKVKAPDPGKDKIKEEFLDIDQGRIVRKILTGMVFLFGSGINLAVGPCLANDNQVVNFINNRLIHWELENGALLAHAAAVGRGDHGLAVAGFSGMGKSTLALHLLSLGFDFISNDRLLLRKVNERLIMKGVPKLPRINPGTALNNPNLVSVIPEEEVSMFQGLTPAQTWVLEHKYDVDINRCFGTNRFRLESPLTHLGILNWRLDGGPMDIEPVDLRVRPDLLRAIKKDPGLFYMPANGNHSNLTENNYLDLLESVQVFELSGGTDFALAARLCQEQLTSINK